MNTVRKVGAATGTMILMLALLAPAAFAQAPPDPTGGAYTGGINDTKSWISSVGAGPLFALAAVVLVIVVALGYFHKGRKAAA